MAMLNLHVWFYRVCYTILNVCLQARLLCAKYHFVLEPRLAVDDIAMSI